MEHAAPASAPPDQRPVRRVRFGSVVMIIYGVASLVFASLFLPRPHTFSLDELLSVLELWFSFAVFRIAGWVLVLIPLAFIAAGLRNFYHRPKDPVREACPDPRTAATLGDIFEPLMDERFRRPAPAAAELLDFALRTVPPEILSKDPDTQAHILRALHNVVASRASDDDIDYFLFNESGLQDSDLAWPLPCRQVLISIIEETNRLRARGEATETAAGVAPG